MSQNSEDFGRKSLLTTLMNILTKIKFRRYSDKVYSSSELSEIISDSSQSGIIDKEEEEMLKGVFSFSNTVAREVMTPRTDLVTIPLNASFDQVLEIITSSGLSRFPVVLENADDVKGVLLSKDLFPIIAKQRNNNFSNFLLKSIIREPYFVPGSKPIDELLNEFKRRKVHLAIVLDEHGGVDGIVSLEDLIEEIVGDIFDESDIATRDIMFHENGSMLVDGSVLIDDINTHLDFALPSGDYDTVAGLVLHLLGRVPAVGDKIYIKSNGELGSMPQDDSQDPHCLVTALANGNGASHDIEQEPIVFLTVEVMDGRRIETIKIHTKEIEAIHSKS